MAGPNTTSLPAEESTPNSYQTYRSLVWFLVQCTAAALIIAYFETRCIVLINGLHIVENQAIEAGVISGHAQLITYQNRMLVPAVWWLTELLAHHKLGYQYFEFGWVLLSDIAAMAIGWRLFRSLPYAVAFTALYAAGVVAFQHHYWFHPWDFCDLTTMLLLAYGVYENKSVKYLCWVFVAELLNRESAGYVALWLAVSAVQIADSRSIKVDWKRVGVGAFLAVICVAYTHLARVLTLGAVTGVDDAVLLPGGEYLEFMDNVQRIVTNSDFAFVTVLAVTVMLVASQMQAWRLVAKPYSIAILVAAMYLSICVFGIVNETRVWLELWPFILVPTALTLRAEGLRVH